MTENSRQPRRSREQWQKIIKQQAQSDLCVREFCQRTAISYASFIKWRSTLAREAIEAPGQFVELDVDHRAPQSGSDCLVELSIGQSITLRIRPIS